MSANKHQGRARRLAVTALAAAEHGLSTGIKWRPPSDHPDIRDAEKVGWIVRGTTSRGSSAKSVTIFRATPAGLAALAKYGSPDQPSLRHIAPSARRRRKDEAAFEAKKSAMRAITDAMIKRMIADPAAPAATRVRMQAIAAKRGVNGHAKHKGLARSQGAT